MSNGGPRLEFPLPDWLGSPSARAEVNIGDFVRSVADSPQIPSLPPLPPSDAVPVPPGPPLPPPPTTLPPLCTPLIAALQPAPIGPDACRTTPAPRTPPTLAQIHASVSAPRSSTDARHAAPALSAPGTFVEVAVYDAEAPTKAAVLRLPTSARLTELVDRIPCTARVTEATSVQRARTGSLLYLGGTLYADRRFGGADYAAPVSAFLRARGRAARVVSLDNGPAACFEDVSVALGVPYVFMHRGDCEHLLMFTDVYKAEGGAEADGERVEVLWRRPARVTPCDICKVRYAEKFTVCDRIADASPFHFCGVCYRDAHYSKSGQLFTSSADFLVYSHPAPL